MTDANTASEPHTGSSKLKHLTYLREYDQWILFSQLSHMGFPIRLVTTKIHTQIDRRSRVYRMGQHAIVIARHKMQQAIYLLHRWTFDHRNDTGT